MGYLQKIKSKINLINNTIKFKTVNSYGYVNSRIFLLEFLLTHFYF